MRKLLFLLIAISHPFFIFSQSESEIRILNELNLYRSKNRLPALEYSKELSKSARHHASYLSICREKNYLDADHDEGYRFSGWNSYSFSKRQELMRMIGYNLSYEIQWQGGPEELYASEVIQEFHSSEEHRKIMSRKSDGSKLVGIGFVKGCTVIVFGSER
jgi:uncharacterized protein YkwD